MLMKMTDGAWTQWIGEPIAGIWHPLNIEQLWSSDELEAIGLYPVTDGVVPEGKIAVSWMIETVEGRPVRIPDLADPPPQSWPPLTIVNALVAMGIADAILAATEEITKAKFYAADRVLETEPLLLGALAAAGKTIDDLKAAIV